MVGSEEPEDYRGRAFIPRRGFRGEEGGAIGPPTCGTTPFQAGQTCKSVARAAGRLIAGLFRTLAEFVVLCRRDCNVHVLASRATGQDELRGCSPKDRNI